MKRHAVREQALKALFACDLGRNDPAAALEMLWAEEKTNEKARNFSRELVEGVTAKREELDPLLERYTLEWKLNRIATVDRNIMRLALFEMLYSAEVPRAVALDEAIELAKTFGSEESPRFINGILGKIIVDLPAED
ncbi:MAG: transcription antitermination factor NusB [Clostridia bacterium]|nr:transcription antitermination factor NusB [Clostridia bacterium]